MTIPKTTSFVNSRRPESSTELNDRGKPRIFFVLLLHVQHRKPGNLCIYYTCCSKYRSLDTLGTAAGTETVSTMPTVLLQHLSQTIDCHSRQQDMINATRKTLSYLTRVRFSVTGVSLSTTSFFFFGKEGGGRGDYLKVKGSTWAPVLCTGSEQEVASSALFPHASMHY